MKGEDIAARGADGGTAVQRHSEKREAARIAGLKDFETPTLEQVERRRLELLAIVFFLTIALALGVALLSTAVLDVPGWAEDLGATATVVRVLIVLLACSFAVYVFEKERHLGKLSRILTNERVLSAALSNRLKEISSVSAAGDAVLSTLELEEILGIILDAASELLEADDGSVLLLEGEELLIAAATGHASGFVGSRRPLDKGVAGWVARNRDPIVVEGRPNPEDLDPGLLTYDSAVRSAISVPLLAKGELLGVLNLNVTTGQRRFNEYDLRALSLFGEHAAIAIRHGRVMQRERELRLHFADLDRLRAEMVGSMTHDLKSPLTTIVGSAKMLLRRFEEVAPDRRLELLESIERQSTRLLELIDRLLDAARTQRDQVLARVPVDLVSRLEPLVSALGSAHDLPIRFESDSPSVEALADPDALDQVVSNLLENAVKHTPADTSVSVRVASRGAVAEVTVADDGPGIPSTDLEWLFEPFKRPPKADRHSGAGLGLFIVSNLVKGMGGEVEVDSEPGAGTRFRITLPALEQADVGSGRA